MRADGGKEEQEIEGKGRKGRTGERGNRERRHYK
jgi:hypothetical protein